MPVIHRNRSAHNQIEELLSYMEQHSEFAKSHITNLGAAGSDKYKQMWAELTDSLNRNGTVQKDSAGWARTWKYMKAVSKKRNAEFTVAMNKTGNDSSVEPLSDFDRRIDAIFGRYGTGLCIMREIGIVKNVIPHVQTDSGEDTVTSSDNYATSALESHPTQWRAWSALTVIIERTCPQMYEILQDFEVHVIETVRLLIRLGKYREKTKTSRSRLTHEQKQIMLTFMEKHKSFSQNRGDGKVNDKLWQALTIKLNGSGTVRELKSWHKSWGDLQRSVDKRNSALKSGKYLHRDDLRVLALRVPEKSILDTDRRYRTPSKSPARSPGIRATPPRRSHSPVRQPDSQRFRSRSPLTQTRSPIFRSRSPLTQTRSPIFRSRSPLAQTRSPRFRAHSQIAQTGSQRFRSNSPERQSSSHASGYRPPVQQSSSKALESRRPVRQSNTQVSQSRLPVRQSRRPEKRTANSRQSFVEQINSAKPVQIDFANEQANQDTVQSSRRFASVRRTVVHSTGENTTAVINAMEENSASLRESVDRLICVFECQNNILTKGFNRIGRKLKYAVLEAMDGYSKADGSDEHQKANEVQEEEEDSENDNVDVIEKDSKAHVDETSFASQYLLDDDIDDTELTYEDIANGV